MKNGKRDWLRLAVRVVFGGVILYLLVLAAWSTTIITGKEHPYLVAANPAAVFFLVTAIMAVTAGLSRKLAGNHWFTGKNDRWWLTARKILLVAIAALGVSIVLTLQNEPGSDQAAVMDVAAHLQAGNTHDFVDIGYAAMNPHQLGLVLIFYLGGKIVGGGNFVFWQLVNVAGVVIIYWCIGKICDESGRQRRMGTLAAVWGLLFLPLVLYVEFVYGTIWGLALALLSALAAERFWQRGRWTDMIWCWVASWLAVMVKPNSAILVLGLAAAWTYYCLRERAWRKMLLAVGLVAVLAANGCVTNWAVRLISGQSVSSGPSYWSYVAMGMHPSSQIFPGWWDGSNATTYYDANLDTARQASAAKAEIGEILASWRAHPMLGLQFLAAKNASAWNNPDFGAILLNQNRPHQTRWPVWARRLLDTENIQGLIYWCKLIQLVILTGVWCYCWLVPAGRKNLAWELMFLGGFVFHSFWEAKSQYTLPYFTLLLILAVAGWLAWAIPSGKKNNGRQQRTALIIGLPVALGVAIATHRLPVLDVIFYQVHGSEEYSHARQNVDQIDIAPGDYLLSGDDLSWKVILGRDPASRQYLIYQWLDGDPLYPELYLSAQTDLDDSEASQAAGWRRYPDSGEPDYWRLVLSDDGEQFYLISGENATLTRADDGTIFVKWWTGEAAQRWSLTHEPK